VTRFQRVAPNLDLHGAFLNAYLGYAIDQHHAGRGIAIAAVSQATDPYRTVAE
jgi:RimJ/RimL family protein N-acetyltransferase